VTGGGAGPRPFPIPVRTEAARDWRRRSPWVARVEAFASRHRDRLAWVHVAMFFGFMGLMIVPLFLPEPGDHAGILNNFTLLANFVIWGLWFPLVFVSVIFTGRSWCGILCPLGASSEWANRVGLKRPVPRWVRWEGTPVVSFVVITVLAQTVDARGFPQGIAVVFGLAFACAVVLGFVYGQGRNKRPWCRHMCPIGLMLGVFSRIGAVQFTPKQPRPGGDAYADKGVCPTMIDIKRKQESRHCIECFRCVNPGGRGGLALVLRRPGSEVADIRHHHPNRAEIWFLFLATGLALGGFLWLILPQYGHVRQGLGVWAIDRGWDWIGTPGPWWLMSVHPQGREVYTWLDFFTITGFMLGCALSLAALLGLLTAASSWLAGRLGADLDLRRRFVEQAYAYMPVAMVSLVVGLGGELFDALASAGLPARAVALLKLGLFALGMLWSVALGLRLLGAQKLRGLRRLAALSPLLAGVALLGLAWWPAIFGL
jgi:hypothetical protein